MYILVVVVVVVVVLNPAINTTIYSLSPLFISLSLCVSLFPLSPLSQLLSHSPLPLSPFSLKLV